MIISSVRAVVSVTSVSASSVCLSVPSSIPSSSSVLCPSVPSSSSVLCPSVPSSVRRELLLT